ncbi:MAG: tyrA [Candidatus Taylorbacteria bacterium]|nr:tyrA [Candidatus Taylorbacteria bacterium]
MNLKRARAKIDKADTKMLKAISKRMKVIPFVAEYKKANGIARYQPDRENIVIESRKKIAEGFSMNPDLAEKIMKLIIEDAHRIEKEILGE